MELVLQMFSEEDWNAFNIVCLSSRTHTGRSSETIYNRPSQGNFKCVCVTVQLPWLLPCISYVLYFELPCSCKVQYKWTCLEAFYRVANRRSCWFWKYFSRCKFVVFKGWVQFTWNLVPVPNGTFYQYFILFVITNNYLKSLHFPEHNPANLWIKALC